jgi:hypothetical protein
VEVYSYGTAYTDTDMKVSASTGDVVSSSAKVTRTWHENPDGTPAVAPIKNEVVGRTNVDLTRVQVPSDPPGGESNLGDVATDAMN